MSNNNLNMNLLTYKAEPGKCEVFYRGKRILTINANKENKYRSTEYYTTEAKRLIAEIKNNDSQRRNTLKYMAEIENELNPQPPEFIAGEKNETVSLKGCDLKYTAIAIKERPNTDADNWFKTSRNYKITLSYGKSKLICYYSKGSGLEPEPPTLKEVVFSLLMDVNFYNDDHDEYFGEVKYTKAKQMEKEILKVKKFFGLNFSIFMAEYGAEE